jgi:hypothetical protein
VYEAKEIQFIEDDSINGSLVEKGEIRKVSWKIAQDKINSKKAKLYIAETSEIVEEKKSKKRGE